MNIQGVRTTVPQVAGTLRKFQGQVHMQTQKQAHMIKAQIRQLVNFRA